MASLYLVNYPHRFSWQSVTHKMWVATPDSSPPRQAVWCGMRLLRIAIGGVERSGDVESNLIEAAHCGKCVENRCNIGNGTRPLATSKKQS